MKKPATLTLRDNKNALARRTERANALLAEALDCMLAGQPPSLRANMDNLPQDQTLSQKWVYRNARQPMIAQKCAYCALASF